MPGSIKVAIQKLANTKRKMMPLYIGIATEKFSESHGHLRHERGKKGTKQSSLIYQVRHLSVTTSAGTATGRICWDEEGFRCRL